MGVWFPSPAYFLGRLGMLNFTIASEMRVKLAKAKVDVVGQKVGFGMLELLIDYADVCPASQP